MNEHDITKKMLDVIRENKTSNGNRRFINENEVTNNVPIDVTNDTQDDGAVAVDKMTIKDEQKKFMEIVGPRVQFDSFNIYPNDSNVVLAGVFDNGLKWQFSKRDGLFITSDNMKLDNETVEIISKLNAYYNNWSDEWAQKLNNEYKKEE